MAGLKEKVTKGAVWVTLERFTTFAVRFVVGMVLARLLTPNDYGTVALLTIFFAVAGTLASCGFGNALVQKKDATDLHFNSVFYASLTVAIFIYGIFFFAAPYIATYYGVPVLCPITRVSALDFIFGAVSSVQAAELSRKMLFHKRFKVSVFISVLSAVLGISFAYLGWGVWALVWSSILTSFASVMVWWTIIDWRPGLMFSFESVKGLFSFGWKLSLSSLIHTTYMNLYGFLIGKIYSPADLAFVNRGNAVPNLFFTMIDGTITGVSFPAMSQLQDQREKFRNAMRRMIQCSTFLVFPIMVGLAFCSRPLILLLYGPQWEAAVPYAQIACFSMALNPFCTINTMAISAVGRSDVYLYLEIIKKGFGVCLMLYAIKYGVFAFMLTMALVQGPFAVFVNTFANGRLLKYTLAMQLRDVLPSILLSAVMAAVVWIVDRCVEPLVAGISVKAIGYFVILALEGAAGAAVYLGLAVMFRTKALHEYLGIIIPKIRTKNPTLSARMERMVARS